MSGSSSVRVAPLCTCLPTGRLQVRVRLPADPGFTFQSGLG